MTTACRSSRVSTRADVARESIDQTEAPLEDLSDVTGHEDGDSYVVCEKSNPKAWIRSDVATERRP